jgi:hypothetical protein
MRAEKLQCKRLKTLKSGKFPTEVTKIPRKCPKFKGNPGFLELPECLKEIPVCLARPYAEATAAAADATAADTAAPLKSVAATAADVALVGRGLHSFPLPPHTPLNPWMRPEGAHVEL